MKKYISGFLIPIVFLLACTVNKNLTTDGTYRGTLPCADCPGIDYQLTLNKNSSYSEKMEYQDRDVPAVLDSGTYAIKNDTILQLKHKPEGSGMRQFAIHKNQLSMLDMNGQIIHSGFADRYILKKVNLETLKQQTELAAKLNGKWKLHSIGGETLAKDVPIPWIELKPEQNRFSGFGGCNSLGGNLELSGDSIKFGRIISTKMACLNHNIEHEFLQTLRNKSWGFATTKSTLTLTNAEDKLYFIKAE